MGKMMSGAEKYKVVKQILRGEMSQRYAAEIMGVRKSSVQAWIRLYESEGAALYMAEMERDLLKNWRR